MIGYPQNRISNPLRVEQLESRLFVKRLLNGAASCEAALSSNLPALVGEMNFARPSLGNPMAQAHATNETAVGPRQRTGDSMIDSEDFVSEIDNPYLPLVAGTTFIYQGNKEGQSVSSEFVVTHMTKAILGVEATVIRDTVKCQWRIARDCLRLVRAGRRRKRLVLRGSDDGV